MPPPLTLTITPGFESVLLFQDNDGLPYVLTVPLIFRSAILGRTVTVPAGFLTDLASIPQVLQNILPKSGRYDRAAVVHDWLYFKGICTRAEADGVLREAMGVLSVGAWTRWVIYAGVRLGGWVPWGRYRARDAGEPPAAGAGATPLSVRTPPPAA